MLKKLYIKVDCVNIIFDDDTTLNSLDVALSTENKKLEVPSDKTHCKFIDLP